MKKAYVTPVVTIEHYELTQAIAACVTKIGLVNSECVKNDPDATNQMKDFAYAGWFTSGNCNEAAVGMDGYDKICYHTNASAAFSS
ncbi:MAG: hypothetical protein IJZ34_00525 [Lachnospiraceae bacterium]|nr:hypothetical protein [Lachnospiraceae bacterium]